MFNHSSILNLCVCLSSLIVIFGDIVVIIERLKEIAMASKGLVDQWEELGSHQGTPMYTRFIFLAFQIGWETKFATK